MSFLKRGKKQSLRNYKSKMKENGFIVGEGWSERKLNEERDRVGLGSNQTLIPMNEGSGFTSFRVVNKEWVKNVLDSVHSQKPFNEFLEFKKELERIEGVDDFEDLLGIRYTPNGVEDVSDEKIYSELIDLKNQIISEKINEMGEKKFWSKWKKGEPKTTELLQPYSKCICGSGELYGKCCMYDNSQKETSILPDWFFYEGNNIYSDTELKLFGNTNISKEELSMIDYINGGNTKEKIRGYIKGLRWLVEQNNPYSLLKVLPLEGMK